MIISLLDNIFTRDISLVIYKFLVLNNINYRLDLLHPDLTNVINKTKSLVSGSFVLYNFYNFYNYDKIPVDIDIYTNGENIEPNELENFLYGVGFEYDDNLDHYAYLENIISVRTYKKNDIEIDVIKVLNEPQKFIKDTFDIDVCQTSTNCKQLFIGNLDKVINKEFCVLKQNDNISVKYFHEYYDYCGYWGILKNKMASCSVKLNAFSGMDIDINGYNFPKNIQFEYNADYILLKSGYGFNFWFDFNNHKFSNLWNLKRFLKTIKRIDKYISRGFVLKNLNVSFEPKESHNLYLIKDIVKFNVISKKEIPWF